MKWYIKFPIVYIVVVVILSIMGGNTWGEASLFVSLILGLFFVSAVYSGYNGYKKKQKMLVASKAEKAKMKEKDRKTNRVLLWIVIGIIVFWIVLFGIAMLFI